MPGHQCFPHACVLLPIPEAKVIVKDVMTTAWPLGLRRVPQPIMPSPDVLWGLHIRLSNPGDKIQGELLVIFSAMHRFMQLRNRGYELRGTGNLEVGRPVCIHSVKEVDEPLAGDVIADEDKGNSAEVLDVRVDDEREDAIHVAVSGQHISSQYYTSFSKNAPFAFLQVSNA